MGINLGGFTAPLITGTVGLDYNFHLGFGVAAVGMAIGLIVYVFMRKNNLGLAGTIINNPLKNPRTAYRNILFGTILLAVVAAAAIGLGYLTLQSFITLVGILGFVIPVCYFVVMYRSPKTTAVERSRIIAYIPLFIASVMFWAIQEQGATILANYADQRTQLEVMGFRISPAWFQSLNPLFIIILAPVFAWLWVRLGERQPSIPVKFSLGLLFAGLSFLIILVPGSIGGGNTLVHPIWLVLSYFIVVLGELCLSPVGLSATTKLAPAAFSSQTMSLWFLSNAAAQAMNAQLVKFYTPDNEILYFGLFGGAAIVLACILFFAAPVIVRFMRGVD